MKTQSFRLPKRVESDPRGSQILHVLNSDIRPLWQGGEIGVPFVTLNTELAAAIRMALGTGRVGRGLEAVKQRLEAEERGLRIAERRSEVPRGVRVSRLLLLTQDGAERFYRHVEALLFRHGHRLLAVLLLVEAVGLGEMLFGPGHLVRLLMVEHKEAVSNVLLAMATRVGQ